MYSFYFFNVYINDAKYSCTQFLWKILDILDKDVDVFLDKI